jgi:hypothetical protein
MRKAWLFALALVPGAALAHTGESTSEKSGESQMLQVPPSAKLIGESQVDEIREFPEMKGRAKSENIERVVGVSATDRLYQTTKSYSDTVSFFDREFSKSGYQQRARVVTPSATAWTVQRPDGSLANAVVRNTKPITIETVEVTGEQPMQRTAGGKMEGGHCVCGHTGTQQNPSEPQNQPMNPPMNENPGMNPRPNPSEQPMRPNPSEQPMR